MQRESAATGLRAPPEPDEPQTTDDHAVWKTPLWQYIRSARLLVVLTLPVIYACAIPLAVVDLAVSLYQLICFPVYRIPKVRRRDYWIFDRGRLRYLNAIEKTGCVYCSYANGLLAFVTEIVARTEQHFCPIKHAKQLVREHSRYPRFLPYGEARTYRTQSERVAGTWDDLRDRQPPP